MNTKKALHVWDKVFPFAAEKHLYPQPWVIRMWCWKYSEQELEYAALTARKAADTGRIKQPTIDEVTQYMSGVMRRRRENNAKVQEDIAAHIAEKAQSAGVSDVKA